MNTKTVKNIVLISSLFMVIGCNDSGGDGKGNGQGQGANGESNQTEGVPSTVTDAINSEKSELTQDLKDSITYMFSEEKLAREVYLNVYEKQPVKQLYNIAGV